MAPHFLSALYVQIDVCIARLKCKREYAYKNSKKKEISLKKNKWKSLFL